MIYCPYCGTNHITEQSNIRKVKDHMFGSKKEWPYLVCNQCRSWILAERPKDEDLYGKNYYTQTGLDMLLLRVKSSIVTRMRRYKITDSYSNTTAFSFSASSAAELGIAWNTKTYKLFGFAYRFLMWGVELFAKWCGWIEKTDNNDMMTYTLQLHEESRF